MRNTDTNDREGIGGGGGGTAIRSPKNTTVSRRVSVTAALAVVLLGWAIVAANTGIAYAALGMDFIPIMTGVVLCLVFLVALALLHRAWWLAVLSVGPALFVLVGSVQYAPEAALDRRGVRETVVITEDSADATGGKNHRYTLLGKDGELDESLEYRGTSPGYRVGDRIEVVYDPEGVVPLEDAAEVDPDGRLSGLVMGVVGWTGMALLAGWRGHVRRRKNRDSLLDQVI